MIVEVLCPLWGPALGSINDINSDVRDKLVSFITELRQYRALLGYPQSILDMIHICAHITQICNSICSDLKFRIVTKLEAHWCRYYICDDCTGMAGRANHSLTNWDSSILLAEAYQLVKATDPFHITVGAVQTSDLWSFSDSTGALSIDVPSPVQMSRFANHTIMWI